MDVLGRAAVDVAAVDHAAMMKAHLHLSERDDSLERLVLIADEPSLECLQILRIEHILGRARHLVGAVGVPADDGPARAGRERLRDELVVPEPDLAGSGEPGGTPR